MKTRKLLSLFICLALIIGLFPAISVSADSEKQILSAYLTIPEPEYGAKIPVYGSSEHEGIGEVEIDWPFGGSTFDYVDKPYDVTVTMYAAEGYVFGGEFLSNDNVFINGRKAKLFYEDGLYKASIEMPAIWVYEEETEEEKFDLVPAGEQDVQIYSWEETVTLKAKVTGTDKYADFQWVPCDKNGKTLDSSRPPISFGEQVTVGPIPQDEMLNTKYYRCDAGIGNTVKSIIFSVTLCPMGIEYENPFTDIKENDWFFDSVVNAYNMGLINGKSDTSYKPNDNLTYAEAIKLAACMHQLYTQGAVTLTGGSPWYKPYVDYCMNNNIIDREYNYTEKATRAGYMGIFANALPDEGLKAINNIPDNSIPDVPSSRAYAAGVYRLYRAGILTGVDKAHNCNPSGNIRRSEVAAILVRMMDESQRVTFDMSR